MKIAEGRRLKIGELAHQTGLSIKTIRYYEGRGLLEQPPRTGGGYRLLVHDGSCYVCWRAKHAR